jgi:hypothetical protein
VSTTRENECLVLVARTLGELLTSSWSSATVAGVRRSVLV